MTVHRTQDDAYTDMVFRNAYGMDTQYDGETGGLIARKGVGTIEDGPTIPRAKNPKIREVKASIPQADIPTAIAATSVKSVDLGGAASRELTSSQYERLATAKSRASAYSAKARGTR